MISTPNDRIGNSKAIQKLANKAISNAFVLPAHDNNP